MSGVDHTTPPWQLDWRDVDPALWLAPADLEARAVELALDAIMATPLAVGGAGEKGRARRREVTQPGRDQTWQGRVEQAIALAFARAFGPWVNGWRWARDEGSIGGGPIGAWCCASHSVQPRGERDPTPTAQRAARAVVEWRRWLETLQTTFAAHDPQAFVERGQSKPDRDAAIALALDEACGALVALVVETTGAGDAWYNHMAQVLAWYLQSRGADVDAARKAADAAVDGRFQSWVGPSAEVLAAARADWSRPARLALR
jgi:hypothetical protein